ncbi:hypothetical protein A3D84_05885 [Candidatus Woesebacteria bacterium RIFCSPHIGHO2_02_FULL_42_20]|uniref:Uncharacterized protein n=1 Tax=Candidatus Woesebacteria bacterium RIFCSPHIGHO2_12_FULL_41_24 TaxID=1802510 RepID=A0A1F8ATH1_9BACT|nr:MAG: hypothetical protein A2W15_01435 [Candidatus Woesebacteria bacterium RBG_16_41_13]OGM29880.1 MAG: hypothetical protein A2873_04235 [Candidatus Woesebacteria bacterium RIFCSPHIGHO2_01_FULL_42_80]OGM35317.1 MAG: hypothetical protein A3D84_05885 [Candidatus Woesebacteria bacterium RIFCSPHIGHO2_02_FULL_42_20]OGM54930.1 MAG: hypothetical protein A3E44_03880 [Candidatus Woesebacteria bacterium RIFCSPHIGHO2_12_FULL_41_24]OGM67561.1 MAG: hypothetical protein A2969_01285 [Candidatus Woesebacteri
MTNKKLVLRLPLAILILLVLATIFTHENRQLRLLLSQTQAPPRPIGTPFSTDVPSATIAPNSKPYTSIVNWYSYYWKTYKDPAFGLEFKYPPENEVGKVLSDGSLDVSFGGLGYLDIRSATPLSKSEEDLEKILTSEGTAGASGIGPSDINDFEVRKYGENTYYYNEISPWEGTYYLDYFLPTKDRVIIFRSVGYTDMGKYQMTYDVYGTDDNYQKSNQEEKRMLETEDFHLLLKILLSSVKVL